VLAAVAALLLGFDQPRASLPVQVSVDQSSELARSISSRSSRMLCPPPNLHPAAILAPFGARRLQMAFVPFAVCRGQIPGKSSGFAVLRGLCAERRGWDSNPRGS
jgi:hypothetical protein